MIDFPKAVMRKVELRKMGFSEEILDMAYRDRRQRFAWKINPQKANSPIEFDTNGFYTWLKSHMSVDRATLFR